MVFILIGHIAIRHDGQPKMFLDFEWVQVESVANASPTRSDEYHQLAKHEGDSGKKDWTPRLLVA